MEKSLAVIVKESGLEATKAKYILDKFQNYFEIASEWEKKAKTLVVTKESQVAEMQMARTGRLFLREKRIAIENARKELKEQALREGKAIDGIANVLKALIVPIEEYLERQEKFIELQQEKKNETLRIAEENAEKIEAEREAKEKAKKLTIENERLRKEAQEREKLLQAEREERKKQEEVKRKAEKEAREKEEKAEAERKAERKKQEEREKKLREEKEKAEEELRFKKEAEERAKREEEERIEALRSADDKTKLLNLAKNIKDIKLPEVKSKKAKLLLGKVENSLKQVIDILKEANNE
jgi:hypothetical protein